MRTWRNFSSGQTSALLAAACIAASVPALAADRPAATVLPLPAIAAQSWAGAFVGIHATAAWARSEQSFTFEAPAIPVSGTFRAPANEPSGLGAGVQAGMTWQTGLFAYGLVGDLAWLPLSKRTRTTISETELNDAGLGAIVDPEPGFGAVTTQRVEWLATVRGRAGVATDWAFFYGTLGLAIAETNATFQHTALVDGDLVSLSARDRRTRVGWTVGAGFEAKIAQNVSFNVDYLYAKFDSRSRNLGPHISLPPFFEQTVQTKTDFDLHSIKLGLNYLFQT